jgi:hypothetical protein
MGVGISGNYDGEGPNVAAPSTTAPGPVTASPDAWATRGSLNNGITGGQSINAMVPVDRRKRLRTSSESARGGVTINVGPGDQVLTVCSRALYVSIAGNIVVRLADDTADVTLSNLLAGVVYPLAIAIVRQTGTTASGVLLL